MSVLSRAEWSMFEHHRAPLDDATCAGLLAVLATDLGLRSALPVVRYFDASSTETLGCGMAAIDVAATLEALVEQNREVLTYFLCLAKLEAARSKYSRILRTQPMPTMNQVGPRGLLQFGTMSSAALTAFMLWRKWMFDIDNRAGQETGYLFEPILAHALGGSPFSSTKSPIRRDGTGRGRQVDCIKGNRAYEFKIRVTIAASGQGRWGEEIAFPEDCRASGYVPVLVVFDPTPNPKLDELARAFLSAGGEAHIGRDAWKHLDDAAGSTMSIFLENYVRSTLTTLLAEVPEVLPDLCLGMDGNQLRISISGECLTIERAPDEPRDGGDPMPDDVGDGFGWS